MKVATRRGARPGRERPFSPGYLVVFDYDEVGNRTRLAINTGGTVVQYFAFDAISQLTSMKAANTDNNSFDANAYEYNEVGHKVEQTHTNDSTSYFDYDDASRLSAQKTLKSTDGSTLASLGYSRDGSGRITQIDKPAGAAGYFSYDKASRVTVDRRWESGVAAQVDYYDYDAAGNRIHRHTYGGAAQNSYYFYDDGDRVTCVHDVGNAAHEYFAYDTGGRIIQRTGIASADPQYYFYDQEARTTSIRSASSEQESFAWDSTGMKRQQGTDDYVFDGANLLSVTDAGGTLDKASGYGPQIAPGVGGLDYQYEDGTGVPVHLEDQVGTGGLVLDSDEAEVTDYNFKSPDLSTFGEGEISAIADGSRVLSEKQFVNPAAGGGERPVGVYDFGARLYDPSLGIFLVPDPLVTGIGVVGLGRSAFWTVRVLLKANTLQEYPPEHRMISPRASVGHSGGSGLYEYVRSRALTSFDPLGLDDWKYTWPWPHTPYSQLLFKDEFDPIEGIGHHRAGFHLEIDINLPSKVPEGATYLWQVNISTWEYIESNCNRHFEYTFWADVVRIDYMIRDNSRKSRDIISSRSSVREGEMRPEICFYYYSQDKFVGFNSLGSEKGNLGTLDPEFNTGVVRNEQDAKTMLLGLRGPTERLHVEYLYINREACRCCDRHRQYLKLYENLPDGEYWRASDEIFDPSKPDGAQPKSKAASGPFNLPGNWSVKRLEK